MCESMAADDTVQKANILSFRGVDRAAMHFRALQFRVGSQCQEGRIIMDRSRRLADGSLSVPGTR
jgi:hypothetical protein